MTHVQIAPSVLAADFLRLGEQLKAVEAAGADRIHVDVMDGRFVPNLSLGLPIVEAVRRGTTLPVEAHLMIEEPERYAEAFAKAGADTLIVHQENAPHLDRTLSLVRGLGKKAGVALNPATPASALAEVVAELDLVLVMTVNPGFGGQRFIGRMLDKIALVRDTLNEKNPSAELEVDGGIDAATGPRVVAAGARVLVAGTAVFGHASGPGDGVRALRAAVSA
jgi:ribulose-phosphate 3-epimerase